MGFTSDYNLTSDPNTVLRDWQHAADLFNVDQFRLAPKHDFLFHVAFGINTAAVPNVALVQKYGQEINMMVKSIDLPNYQVSTDMLNQYNRKKIVQYQYKPQEIQIKFHDDNMGLINQLWQAYYSYYYADPRSATVPGAYARNATQSSNYIPSNYGLDNGSTAPFFNYIKIYQMARHEYVLYQLVNPIITSFNHNRVSYDSNKTREFDMKIMYEAVAYNVGAVDPNLDPAGGVEGFGQSHYDYGPSPLSGINPDPTVIDPSFVQSLDIESNSGSFLAAVLNQVASAQNNTAVSSGSSGGGLSGLGTIAAIGVGAAAIGALSGISFGGIGSAISGGLSAVGGAIGGAVDSATSAVSSAFGGSDSSTGADVSAGDSANNTPSDSSNNDPSDSSSDSPDEDSGP